MVGLDWQQPETIMASLGPQVTKLGISTPNAIQFLQASNKVTCDASEPIDKDDVKQLTAANGVA